MKNQVLYIACLAACLMGIVPNSSKADGYQLLKEIPVREGGAWTAMAVDETARRLYAAHGNRIEVINLNNDVPAGAITDTLDVRGLALAPSFHMGYASSGKAQSVSLIDLNNLRTTAKMKTGATPTAVVFELSKLQLFSFNQGDHSATAGEADDGDFLATIDLGGKPTSAVTDASGYEAKNGRVFAAVEDKNEVVTVDVATHQIVAHWPVAPGQSPHCLAYDGPNHRLFAGCGNGMLVMMDSTSGKVAANLPVSEGAGSLVCDSSTQQIFCANGDGTVTVAHEDAPDKISVVQTLKTKQGPTVLALDGKTHKLFIGTADYRGGVPIPGTLKVSVYGAK